MFRTYGIDQELDRISTPSFDFADFLVSTKWCDNTGSHDTYWANVTNYTGNSSVQVPSYSGTGINANIGAVTDISDPAGTGGWTDLIDLTGGPSGVYFESYSSTFANIHLLHNLIRIDLPAAEPATTYIRGQILIDGTIVWDGTAQSDGVNQSFMQAQITLDDFKTYRENVTYWYYARSQMMNFASTFKIRMARQGTISNAGSWLSISQWQTSHTTLMKRIDYNG